MANKTNFTEWLKPSTNTTCSSSPSPPPPSLILSRFKEFKTIKEEDTCVGVSLQIGLPNSGENSDHVEWESMDCVKKDDQKKTFSRYNNMQIILYCMCASTCCVSCKHCMHENQRMKESFKVEQGMDLYIKTIEYLLVID
ncbi:hypothetical protein QJS04_geneDACA024866 [Acorus gramineus]|uniref:Uncharacterized protein n=1 Tax=Acorus gramineus TaxID=55184 RepID=A0AAV9A0S0_ACOGR|nr:hypothetical protein QJS04_geneDACA024866 [Acorus gramineus]